MDETDLSREKEWKYEAEARRAVARFEKRGLYARFASSRAEARELVLGLIPEGASVGWGDSITLHETGVIEAVHGRKDVQLYDPFERAEDGHYAVPGPGHLELMRKAATADVFITGANAITKDGKIMNLDAIGNRVAPLIFGPKRVIVVAGANKIVKDVERGLERLKEVAPLNVRRHYLKHHFKGVEEMPCFKTGVCADCTSPYRICSFIVIVQGEQTPVGAEDYAPRIHVIIVGEELGL